MMLNDQGRDRLKRQREQYVIDAARLLLEENNADGAAQALQKIKTGDELLKHCDVSMVHSFRPFLPLLLCFVVVTFLWICSKENPTVHLDVKTETAMLTLAEKSAWTLKPYPVPAAEDILIEGIFGIEAPGLGMSGAAERLVANGKSITLEYIDASGGSRLEVERNDSLTDFYIYEGEVNGIFQFQDSEMLVFSSGTAATKKISGPIPESLSFKAVVKGGTPLHLRLKTSKDFHLDGLQISNMVLQREEPPRSGSFVSAIVSGTVALPEVKREESLEEHDWLRLKEASSTRLLLTFAGASKDSFALHFQGTARSLSAGPKGFEKDLTPSLLLWLYHNQKIAMFWSALVFGYSLLLGLRSILEKK